MNLKEFDEAPHVGVRTPDGIGKAIGLDRENEILTVTVKDKETDRFVNRHYKLSECELASDDELTPKRGRMSR